jgi:hypothetical protein
MRIRPTDRGLPASLGGAEWEFVPSDRALARKVIIYLENRRLLGGIRQLGDEKECVRSAIQIRRHLSKSIAAAHPERGLESALRGMRAACKKFVDKAGSDEVNFRGLWGVGDNFFGASLHELHSWMGFYIETIVNEYDLEIEEELASIFPHGNAELSWLPSFTRNAREQESGNAPFTPAENAEISNRLREIKASLRQNFELAADQFSCIEERLDEAEEASRRLGRKDWLQLFLGIVFSLIITGTVTPDAGEHILMLALHGLSHLFLGGFNPILGPTGG